MKTRTTTIRLNDAQLRLLELIAQRDGATVADVQRDAFSAYIDARALADDELRGMREKVAEEWKDEDEARRQAALQRALGKSVS